MHSPASVIEAPSLTQIVLERAAANPDRDFAIEVGGRSANYETVAREMDAWARGFASLGLSGGDVVCSMRPASVSGIAAWLGASRIGAIDAGVAVTYRGDLLLAQLRRGKALVIEPGLIEQIEPFLDELDHLVAVVVVGDDKAPSLPGIRTISEADLLSVDHDVELVVPKPWDVGCLTLTSGTTGPSKGVLLPWGHLYGFSTALFDPAELSEDDVFYSPMPMNHVAQRVHTYLMGVVGGKVVVRNAFSPGEYWDDIRRFGCTITNASVGARILHAMPESPEDAGVPLTKALISPLFPEFRDFEKRFGLEVRTMFGSTEVGLPIISDETPPNERTSGRRNRRFPHYEVRLVDEHDIPVPVGRPGELIVRTPHPWTLNAGYLGQPDVSFAAWRNGWFHTGDLMLEDEDGWFYFVDRVKDSIRRRGENISTFEVERVLNMHEAVLESAVIGVAEDRWGEQEVLAALVASPGATIDESELIDYLATRLPRFMVPRYIRVVGELPKSPATLRIQKHELRSQGITDDTWDTNSSMSDTKG